MKNMKQNNNLSNYIFPNELNNRNDVAIPNKVWAIDLTTLKQPIESKPNHQIKLIVIIDFAAKNIIKHKLFLVRNNGCIKAKYITKLLRELYVKHKIKEELIIHTDRGAEFTSKEYHDFIKSHKYVIPSMSKANKPTDNSVVERTFRTIKHQIEDKCKLPKSFKSLYFAEIDIANKVNIYNQNFVNKKSLGLSKDELAKTLATTIVDLPKELIHWNLNDQINHNIKQFKEKAVVLATKEDNINWRKIVKETHSNTQELKQAFSQNQADLKYLLYNIVEEIKELKENQNKLKYKKKHKSLPLRQPANNTIYEYIMKQKKPKKVNQFVWSRNRIAITLLFFLGLRANELINVTKDMLNNGIIYSQVDIYQSKNNKHRLTYFTEHLKKQLKQDLSYDIGIVLKDNSDVLGWSKRSKAIMTENKWIATLNKFIQPAVQHFKLNLSSHSFRINYITQLLRKVPVQQVKELVGHQSITTTVQYNRFRLNPKDATKLIDSALLDSEKEEANL